MSDIFREIEEELRRDNLLKLWSRYGRYIIAAVVLVLLIAGGIAAWREQQLRDRRAQSVRYSSALVLAREGKDADAVRAFADIGKEKSGYSALAAFEEAQLQAKSGDTKTAIATYDRIAASSDYDKELRDLAVLLSVMHGLSDGDANALAQRLEPLTASGNPWRPTALEVVGAARLKAGDKAAALEVYKKLADDLSAPQGLRARAAEMAAALAP